MQHRSRRDSHGRDPHGRGLINGRSGPLAGNATDVASVPDRNAGHRGIIGTDPVVPTPAGRAGSSCVLSQQRRHRAIEGVGDRPDQLSFGDGHLPVGRDRRGARLEHLFLDRGRCRRDLAQRSVDCRERTLLAAGNAIAPRLPPSRARPAERRTGPPSDRHGRSRPTRRGACSRRPSGVRANDIGPRSAGCGGTCRSRCRNSIRRSANSNRVSDLIGVDQRLDVVAKSLGIAGRERPWSAGKARSTIGTRASGPTFDRSAASSAARSACPGAACGGQMRELAPRGFPDRSSSNRA